MENQPTGGEQPPSIPAKSNQKTLWDNVEGKYYSFCDWLQDHGLPIYDFFVYPLEDRGIPSLPAFVIILLALLLGAGWIAMGGLSGLGQQAYALQVSVYSEQGPIEGAILTLYKDGGVVSKTKTNSDGISSFEELQAGDYALDAEKEGFETASLAVSVPRESSVDVTLVSKQKISFEGGKQPNGKKTEEGPFNEIDYGDLSLKIFVTDIAGNPLDATANVFDKNAGTKIGTVIVRNGFGSLDGLEAGMVVYADVSAQGHVPYLGKNNATTISAESPNSISVKLFKITNDTESKATLVKVRDLNGTPLNQVLIKVFRKGNPFALIIPNQYTNATGELAIDLNSSGNPDYKILASKTPYVDTETSWFKAGTKVEITLKKQSEMNQSDKDKASNLTVTVTFNGSVVANAAVAVFHDELATREGFTNSQGKISFYILNSRGLTVTVNASKNNMAGSKQVALDSEQVQASVELERRKASVRVRAFNYSNGLLIENAAFEAKTGGATVSSCAVSAPNFDCVLQIGIGLNAEINASAPTFVSETKYLSVNNETMALDFSLLPEYAVQSSLIKDFVVTPEGGNSNVTTLYPGKRYEAKFTLIGKTNSTSDEFGFYFGVETARAVIKRVTPPSTPTKTLGSTTAACNPVQIDYNNANAAWVDLTYAGANGVSSKSVRVVFEVKPLGQGVQESNVTLRYRSFLVQGGKYYRNPLNANDPPETRFEPKSPLASGCNSPTFNALYAINGVGVSCSEYACVSVLFTQNGQQSAKNNFTMMNFGEGSTPPVVMLYEITFKKDVRNNPADISFSFNAPGSFIGLVSASYPDQPDEQGTPPQPPNKIEFLNGTPQSFSADLSHLKRYSNMDEGFKFNGDFVIKPLSSSNVSGEGITLQLAQGVDAVRHNALYNIQANGSQGGCTQNCNEQVENSAKLQMLLRQRRDSGSYITNPLSLYAIGLCSYESILHSFLQVGLPKCAGSFVELNYTVTVNDTQGGRGWVFFNSTANGITLIQNLSVSKQRGQGISFVQGLENGVYNGFFNISLNDVVSGDIVNVSFLAITSETPKFSNFKFVFHNGLPNWFDNQTKLNAMPYAGGPPAQFDYFPCGKAAITLDIPLGGQGQIDLNSSCRDVILQVDPIMPLDAIPVEFTQSFRSNCGTLRLNRLFPPTDGSRDLSQKIQFDMNLYPQTAWISFNSQTAGLLKGNWFDTDPRFPGLNYLGKATLRLDCSRLPNKFVDIAITAKAVDSRIPPVDGSYIYYEGMPHQLIYSLYNGQLPRDLLVSPSNETTTVKTRTRAFDASNRVNYFLINHRSTPIGISIKGTPSEEGIVINEFSNRFGSVYSHMIAVSHLDLITLGKYLHFLDSLQLYPPSQQNAIWNSTCPSIDYVSEVTHQIPRNFVEEVKRISLITGFRRSPPQNGYWCGHRKDRPQGERTCYPTILNWMQPGINETTQTIQCPAPACLQASEADPDSYTADAITLSVSPQQPFPPEGQQYAFSIKDSLVLSADASGLPAGTNVTAASVEFKSKESVDCPIAGASWCSTTFLNDGVDLQKDAGGLWNISYAGISNAQNGEYAVRIKAANETGGVFFYSPWVRIIVENNAAACFALGTQRENVPLCAEPVCDPFCRPDGTKEIVTNAGPALNDPQSWWLNDTVLEFVPAAEVEGIENYAGMPFAYFRQKGILQNDFSLSSPLMQWNWNIDDVANAGFTIENDAKCVAGTGFYELKASSADGEEWSFSVALKKLPLSGYFLNNEPSDSDAAREGYIDDLPPNPRSAVFAKGRGCGIGTDPGFDDEKFLCNAKNLVVGKHTHHARNSQILDCFIPCKYNNCGYCINFNLPFEQYEWQACLPPANRNDFSSFQALRQASTNPNLPPELRWAYGVGQELGGCPNEATRISD
ncbi:MAG: carboxypeptidase-like regulatory domain-containing protein [Candidatus Norongarragalinales archaeon]